MRYTIVVTHGLARQTVYDGYSYITACKVVDIVRGVLIMTNGTAAISAQYGLGGLCPVWDVTDGQAEARTQLRQPPVIQTVP